MTTQEMIEVMQAYEDGEKIQIRDISDDEENPDSREDIKDPSWDWARFDYRVKSKESKFKDDDRLVAKADENCALSYSDFYTGKELRKYDKDTEQFVKADDVLWYWEYQDEDGHWNMTDYRATRAEIEKLSNFHNFAPLYGLGFRLKDEK